MDLNTLSRMANQIARAFETQGHDAAVAATAEHIMKFWDPRMKAGMLGGDRSPLTPIAAEAMQRVEKELAAKAA